MSPPSGHRQATVQVSTFCRHRKERRCAAASHRPPTSCRRGRWTSADPAEKPRGLPLRWKRPGTADASRMSPWPPIITCDGFSPTRDSPTRREGPIARDWTLGGVFSAGGRRSRGESVGRLRHAQPDGRNARGEKSGAGMDTRSWERERFDLRTGIRLDPKNVRLETADAKVEADIMEDLFANEGALGLVEGICAVGYLTHETPIVVKRDGANVVVEGNRRIAALKAMQNPMLVPDFSNRISALLKRYPDHPEVSEVDAMAAVIVRDMDKGSLNTRTLNTVRDNERFNQLLTDMRAAAGATTKPVAESGSSKATSGKKDGDSSATTSRRPATPKDKTCPSE